MTKHKPLGKPDLFEPNVFGETAGYDVKTILSAVEGLKQEMEEYRFNNDLWRKEPDVLLDEFIDLIDKYFGGNK